MTPLTLPPQATTGTANDPRLAIFRSAAAREVFHSVCQRDQIWRPCLWDVQEIHEDARSAFYATLDRAFVPPGTPYGHLLLLLGEAGSGKTHLMRAIRTHVHGNRLGYCTYMQMTTATENYGRYILSNVIDSLDDIYFEAEVPQSGLMVLSNALLEDSGLVPAETIERLRTGELSGADLAHLTVGIADRLIADKRYEGLDPDIMRALCCLQRDEAPLKSRVLKFLRCEPLNEFDQPYLPGLTARIHDHQPLETVGHLARTMRAAHGRSFVLLIDQLEDMANFDVEREAAAVRFRRAIQTLCALAGDVSSSVFVVSCLEDFYEDLRKLLTGPARDRLEQDPPPVRLVATRTADEVVKLVSVRLHELYHAAGVSEDDPIFPFPAEFLQQLAGLRTRDVLERCQRFRDSLGREAPAAAPITTESTDLAMTWNDFRTSFSADVPESEEDQARILAAAISACGEDLPGAPEFSVQLDGRQITVTARGLVPAATARLLIAVCNKRAQGGGLKKQLESLRAAAADRIPVILRSAEFPDAKTQTGRQIDDFLKAGGRRAAVEDSHWRQMLAFERFREQYAHHVQYRAWRQAERPLAGLKPLIDILELDQLVAGSAPVLSFPQAADAESAPQVAPSLASEETTAAPVEAFLIAGVSIADRRAPIALEIQEFSQPAAFLGGPESGVLTASLNLIEQLLLMGVPTVLVDRRGTLCGYATDRWWKAPADSPDLAWRRGQLRERLDVAVYAPGAPHGNPLVIPLVPPDISQLPASERGTAARTAAEALAGLLEYTQSSRDQKLFAVLFHAILNLSQRSTAGVNVAALADFVAKADAALVDAAGATDRKLLDMLAADLQTLAAIRGTLLAADGRPLDVAALFGATASRPAKTPLSVICTKFLGDNSAVEFWLAQFLSAVDRWVGVHPADRLRGVLLIDDADLYLPSARQPATRTVLESLLQRARSAGLGVFLVSNNANDLDFSCRENIHFWFIGRTPAGSSAANLRSLFDTETISRLANQEPGDFTYLSHGQKRILGADTPVLDPQPLGDDEILDLAAISRARS
jgi:hypothetical protein